MEPTDRKVVARKDHVSVVDARLGMLIALAENALTNAVRGGTLDRALIADLSAIRRRAVVARARLNGGAK